jgi:hypothetical protein
LILLMALGFTRGYCNFDKADSITCDSGQLTISIECVPTLEGASIQRDDILVATYNNDSIQITDSIWYNELSDNIMTLPVLDFELVDGYTDYLHFAIYSTSGSCQVSEVAYHYDESVSSYCYIVIDTMNASLYSITYPADVFCLGTDSVFPITDVPGNAILYDSDSLLCLSNEGVFVPGECQPGNYTVYFSSDYCLSADLFDLSISESVRVDLPDTISICSGDQLSEDGVYSGYSFYTQGNTIGYDYTELASEGLYTVEDDSTDCALPDTAYIQLIESPLINLNIQEECDRAIVTFDNSDELIREFNWTNGDTDSQVVIYSDSYIGVTVINESGCISFDSVFVDVNLLEIPDVQYEKADASCWLEGSISIASSLVNNNVGAVKYQMHNTINDRIYNDLENVSEGLYYLEVVDERNCVAAYTEPITVLQQCLDDYPVISPNGDDIEDTYFIPYEGKIKIFDLNGTLRREMTTPAYWDGNDGSGNPLPMGTYAIITDSGKIVNITIVK